MRQVGFGHHFVNNNILILRRIYADIRQWVSKSSQNGRKLYCLRLQQYTMRRIEYYSSFNTCISMKLDQKRESGLVCAELKARSHRGFLRSRVRRYCKNLEIFMASIFFSISNGKFVIVKVLHGTQRISSKPADYSIPFLHSKWRLF